MCDTINVDQPRWKELSSIEAAKQFAEEVSFWLLACCSPTQVSYPCLMRPSYILSGTAMRVAHSPSDLENDFKNAVVVSRDYPVVLSKFILGIGLGTVFHLIVGKMRKKSKLTQSPETVNWSVLVFLSMLKMLVLNLEYVLFTHLFRCTFRRCDNCASTSRSHAQDHGWMSGNSCQNRTSPSYYWPFQHTIYCQSKFCHREPLLMHHIGGSYQGD